jgi:hypothetical protein
MIIEHKPGVEPMNSMFHAVYATYQQVIYTCLLSWVFQSVEDL